MQSKIGFTSNVVLSTVTRSLPDVMMCTRSFACTHFGNK